MTELRRKVLPQNHRDTEEAFKKRREWLSCSISLYLYSRIFIMLCSIGWLSLAAATVQAQTPNVAVNYGGLTGRVIGEDGPVPFANVTVTAVGGRGQGNGSHTVTTDAEGNFKVDGLRAAALQINVNAPGYVQESGAVSVAAAEPDAPVEAVTQTYYRIGDDVTIWLVKGGVITGRVLNPAGDPVIGVRVSAQATGATATSPVAALSTMANNEAQTDDRGIYRIFGLPAGTYVVVANAGAMGGGGFGAGFGGGRGGPQRNPFASDAPVYYPSGSRAAAAEITVNGGAETSGIDIQYRSMRGFAISGTVADATSDPNLARGRGGAFTAVTLTHKASGQLINTTFLAPRGGPLGRRGATTGNAATFSILGVADGEYEVTAQRNSGDNVEAAAPVRVLVSGNDVTGLALTLKPLAAVRAQLQLESGSKCPAPRPVVLEEQVFALRAEAANAAKSPVVFAPAPISVPNRGGELNFRGLAAGRYRLKAELLDERLFIRTIASPAPSTPTKPTPATKAAPKAPSLPNLLDLSRSGLMLKAGERLSSVVVAVAEGAAALDGKVVKAGTATPAALMQVHLIPVERERAEDVLRYAETSLGPDGAFRFRHLAPGKYWVLVQAVPKDASPSDAPLAWDAAARLRLRRAAEAANQVLELQPCQRLAKYELQLK
jgi:hypothetical protein